MPPPDHLGPPPKFHGERDILYAPIDLPAEDGGVLSAPHSGG